jgi:two-component system cell cycle sensor histidine kinase/response regulator CckA
MREPDSRIRLRRPTTRDMTLLVIIVLLAGVIVALVARALRRGRPEVAAPGEPSLRPATAGGPPAVEGDPAVTGTVLLVEDDAALRGSTQRILARAGFGVLTAASGAEGLETWRSHDEPIDVVLSDVVMPGGSGVHLATEITALSPGTPIVLISGFTPAALEQHRLVSESIGDVPLLQKPLAPGELVATMRNAIASGRRPQSA